MVLLGAGLHAPAHPQKAKRLPQKVMVLSPQAQAADSWSSIAAKEEERLEAGGS